MIAGYHITKNDFTRNWETGAYLTDLNGLNHKKVGNLVTVSIPI